MARFRRLHRFVARTVPRCAGTLLAVATVVAGCVDPPHASRERPREEDAPPAATPKRQATAPSNGFGDAIAWRGFDEGLAESKAQGLPMLLVVHASWCPKCKELKPKFAEQELVDLSERFVMVNVDQDEVPAANGFGPDGTYVPRVLVVKPDDGRPDAELVNERRSRTVYYYSPQDDLVGTMKKALSRYGKT